MSLKHGMHSYFIRKGRWWRVVDAMVAQLKFRAGRKGMIAVCTRSSLFIYSILPLLLVIPTTTLLTVSPVSLAASRAGGQRATHLTTWQYSSVH